MLSVARDVERICPDAWLIQSGNPVFDGCTLLHRETNAKVIGLCHGHYGYLGLDSWCRGKLKRIYPRIRDADAFAARRYKPFGQFAGLAMWLDLTKDWHDGETKDFG